MIHKLVNRRKMSYLKKFPRPVAVLFFKFIIILDEILWTLRIKLSIKILGKKSEIGNV